MSAGMHWYTCDLHVHTPVDIAWQGPGKPANGASEQDLQACARTYLGRCHDLGLEVIGVTDHNFSRETDPRRWFLTHLIEQNQTVAEERKRPPLIIFPGFEVDIGYHVLCLFDPVTRGRDLAFLSEILTRWGLSPGERFLGSVPQPVRRQGASVTLREVLDHVQKDQKVRKDQKVQNGIVIAAHAFSDKELCNTPTFLKDFIEHGDLLAVEVPDFPLRDKAASVLGRTDQNWSRASSQPLTALMSSDAKGLGNDPPEANQLGYRTSRIKMSQPSIESLRQAFLDPESRVHLGSGALPAPQTWIDTLAITGNRFLADATFHLNPHLTCIIGGRGSGKSLVLESLRHALRCEHDSNDPQHKRLAGSYSEQGTIQAKVRHHGQTDCFQWTVGGKKAEILGRPAGEVAEPAVVFQSLQAQFFSQEELTGRSAGSAEFAAFIASLAGDSLLDLQREARTCTEALDLARQQAERVARLSEELRSLDQETVELGRQMQVFQAVQADLKRHRAAQEARHWMEQTTGTVTELRDRLHHMMEDLTDLIPAPSGLVTEAPNPGLVQTLQEQLQLACQELRRNLGACQESFATACARISTGSETAALAQMVQDAQTALTAACQRSGIQPEQIDRLRSVQQDLLAKQRARDAKQAELREAQSQAIDPALALQRLTTCWWNMLQVKQTVCRSILASPAMVRAAPDQPMVEITMRFAADHQDFKASWATLAPRGNTRAGKAWDGEIADDAFRAFQDSLASQPADSAPRFGNPYHWLEQHLAQAAPDGYPKLADFWDEVRKVRAEKAALWQQALTKPTKDHIDLILRRKNDGSEAGRLSNNQLSTGQRNTALLALLLAQGQGPLVIDQPEDEIDSQFIYQELVPLLRQAKLRRQIILVTHNPNLPVNADAELVLGLHYRDGKGQIRCSNGMDDPLVTESILDIMEGTEAAFERRRKKYGF